MIFFVAGTTCPAGSAPAVDAAGRMLLAITDVSVVGRTFGTPLADQEDRVHSHPGSMAVNMRYHAIAAISGGGNGQGTSSGEHSVALVSQNGTSGLPFIQLLVCRAN